MPIAIALAAAFAMYATRDFYEKALERSVKTLKRSLEETAAHLAALCEEVFGDRAWRYQKPEDRDSNNRAHLKGYDVERAPRFRWPEGLEEWYRDYMRKKRRRD